MLWRDDLRKHTVFKHQRFTRPRAGHGRGYERNVFLSVKPLYIVLFLLLLAGLQHSGALLEEVPWYMWLQRSGIWQVCDTWIGRTHGRSATQHLSCSKLLHYKHLETNLSCSRHTCPVDEPRSGICQEPTFSNPAMDEVDPGHSADHCFAHPSSLLVNILWTAWLNNFQRLGRTRNTAWCLCLAECWVWSWAWLRVVPSLSLHTSNWSSTSYGSCCAPGFAQRLHVWGPQSYKSSFLVLALYNSSFLPCFSCAGWEECFLQRRHQGSLSREALQRAIEALWRCRRVRCGWSWQPWRNWWLCWRIPLSGHQLFLANVIHMFSCKAVSFATVFFLWLAPGRGAVRRGWSEVWVTVVLPYYDTSLDSGTRLPGRLLNQTWCQFHFVFISANVTTLSSSGDGWGSSCYLRTFLISSAKTWKTSWTSWSRSLLLWKRWVLVFLQALKWKEAIKRSLDIKWVTVSGHDVGAPAGPWVWVCSESFLV